MVRVNNGQVGLAWQDNQPLFMQEPGLYSFDSPSFIFVRHAAFDEKVIELGTKKIVTVYSGEVALSYRGGELRVLFPGRHTIEDPSHVVKGFLSTQQQSVRLVALEHVGGKLVKPTGTSNALVCETRELVKVGIHADVFYSIEDPERAINRIAQDEIETLVLETSLATLTNIIKSTSVNEIAQSKLQSASAQKEPGDASTSVFFDHAHDEFLSRLHEDFMTRYGIDICNIRIESLKILNEDLASNISQQALTTAQTESQLANLAGQTEIATREQERVARVQQIGAAAEAGALRTRVDAQNSAMISRAKAEAQAAQLRVERSARAEAAATVERARAEAEAIRVRGQAEAEAFELMAAAEASRARQLAETPLGSQLSLLTAYSEMAAKSNEGVEKVVYTDLQHNNLGPLAMPSLQALGRDLALLSGVGADAAASQPT